MGNCLLVKAPSSLAQTSVMIWTLELWVLIVPSDFADLGQKRWEKISIDAVAAACWNKVSVELPNYHRVFVPYCFILLPCPFLQLAKEIVNENQVRVFSEHQSPKDNQWKKEAFSRCYQKCKWCIFSLEWFFPLQYLYLCNCKALGKSYWKPSWWWLPGESQYSSKAYSESLFIWWKKRNLKILS